MQNDESVQAAVFANRGILLALPAAAIAMFGKPTATSIACGLPVAFAGEFARCWAVGYSGDSTRADHVTAGRLVSAGPYAYVRNPLYLANLATAFGFALAFTGGNGFAKRWLLRLLGLGTMAWVYATIVPHEEEFLRSKFGADFDAYCERVPRFVPLLAAAEPQDGTFDPGVIARAETKTFASFGAMLTALTLKAARADKR
jgi:protein-S-isoprenylcysteine O-methyltransferase Ste14